MTGCDHPDASRSIGTRAMLVLVAGVVVYLTLRPFVPRVPISFEAIKDVALSYDRETIQHIMPAIVIVMLTRAGWSLGRWRAAGVCFAGLLTLEIVQVFIEYRHARMGDLVAQAVGLAIGARMPAPTLSRTAWRIVWAATLLTAIGLAITVGVRGQFGHTLGPMDRTFRLVIADEHYGGRPWLGDFHGFAIETDTSTDPVIEFGPEPDEGEWAGHGSLPIVLQPAHEGWSSIEPVPELCAAIDDVLEIIVSLDVTSASMEQTGPARLLTVSKGMSYRNLTVGQEGDALVLRVRTPRSGRNASSPQFMFPNVFAPGERLSLQLWTDGGSARLWIDGELAAEQFSYTTPRDWLGLKPGPADALGVIALFAPIGLSLGTLAGLSPSRCARRSVLKTRRVWIAAAGVPIVILGVIWGTSFVLDRPVAWWLLPSSMGASLAGMAVTRLLGSHR